MMPGGGRPADPGDAVIEILDAVAPSPLDRYRVDLVAVPFRTPVPTASGTWAARRSMLVTLRDGDGVAGIGEIAPAPGEEEAAMAVLASLAPRLAGLAPAQVLVAIEEDRATGRELALASALEAGIETALLDLASRRAGMPVAALLAGASGRGVARLAVPVSALVSADDPAGAAAEAAAAVATGTRCIKIKVGSEPDVASLVRRIAAVREAAGDDVELRLDANGSWSIADAAERLEAAEPYRIAYAEQPVASIAEMAALRRAVRVPIAADETVTGAAAARRLVDAGAVDALVVKPARAGGPVETLRIAAVGAEAGVPVVLSTFFETGIGLAAALHVAAALPGADVAHGIATASLLASDLLLFGPEVADGTLVVPDAAGLGVDVDPGAVARFRDPSSGLR
jgi:L-Ala-D/L-Glu epimerase